MAVNVENFKEKNESIIKYYRYQPADEDRIKDLSADKIWVSDPNSFNDPVDTTKPIENSMFRAPFDSKSLKQSIKILFSNKKNYLSIYFNARCLELIESWVNQENNDLIIYDVISEIEAHYKTFGIICLSPNFDSQIMWSHYASQHQGFVIEYSYDLLSFDPEYNFTTEDVSYTNARPHMCISEFLFTPHLAYRRLLSTKHSEWSYEKEVRLIHKTKNHQLVAMPQGLKLSALIAGPKTSSIHKELLLQKAKSLDVDMKCVENNGYEIVANPFGLFGLQS